MYVQNQPLKRAFTLIEVLSVIAVASIMAAFLMPALSQARERGRRAKCMSNIRQLAIAMYTYAHDHDGNFQTAGVGPDMFDWRAPGYPIASHPWKALSNYLANTEVLYCPSALMKKTVSPSLGGSYPGGFQSGTMQPWGSIMLSDTHYGYMQWMNDSMPANYVLVFESPCLYGHQIGSCSSAFMDNNCTLIMGSGAIFSGTGVKWWGLINSGVYKGPTAHDTGSNVAFVDGHVEWQSRTYAYNPGGGPRNDPSVQWINRYDSYSPTLENNGYGCSFVW